MQSADLDVPSGALSILYLIIARRLVPSPFPRSYPHSILSLSHFFFFLLHTDPLLQFANEIHFAFIQLFYSSKQ